MRIGTLCVAMCVLIGGVTLGSPQLGAQYYDDPYEDPYFNPFGPSRQPDYDGVLEQSLRRVIPSYEQQMLEEQRRQNSGHNSWMNQCHAMAGNPAAQARCYQGAR